ncbi:MAG: DUF6434 domain-containing protein [Chloroflexota bacterium]
MNQRPKLTKEISVADFRDFYWLKKELVEFCRAEGLSRQGGKLEIADRIESYLTTGRKESKPKKPKAISNFDWNNEPLTVKTIITDNYKNSENVRTFFTAHIGNRFKFSVPFMNWMKGNHGKTLGDAIEAWHEINQNKKAKKDKKNIAPQFEYNRYIRDFLEDNPTATRAEAIEHWKIKRSMRGDNVYRKSDVENFRNG